MFRQYGIFVFILLSKEEFEDTRKGQSESVNRRTDNTMAKNVQKGQTTIYKTYT